MLVFSVGFNSENDIFNFNFYSSFLGYFSTGYVLSGWGIQRLGFWSSVLALVWPWEIQYTFFESQVFHLNNGQSGPGHPLDQIVGIISLATYASLHKTFHVSSSAAVAEYFSPFSQCLSHSLMHFMPPVFFIPSVPPAISSTHSSLFSSPGSHVWWLKNLRL